MTSGRVAKTTGGAVTDFIYDREGHIILTNPATPTLVEMYAAGLHLGTYVLNTQHTDTIFYYNHSDWLGTERARTDLTGTVCESITSLPFGDNQVTSGTCGDVSPMHFTGKMRDTESNLDYFDARYYSSTLGRFMIADWAAKPTAVPYAMFGNPQSLNLYSYVKNNPTTVGDPDGHLGGADDAVVAAVGALTIAVMATQMYYAMPPEQRNFGWAISQATSSVVGMVRGWLNADNSAQSGEKKVPNPNGSKGAPDHQHTADEEAAKMGPNGQREVRVPTPDGEKGSRVIDAAKVENGKVTEATQVVRPTRTGRLQRAKFGPPTTSKKQPEYSPNWFRLDRSIRHRVNKYGTPNTFLHVAGGSERVSTHC
jgi:RHS repeat-associated protein